MKYLKTYKIYKESLLIDILESLNIWHDVLLSSIDAKEVDIYDTLKLPKDFFSDNLDLDFLFNNTEFINSLSSIALKKSNLENTETYQTFLNKPCKFMFLYGNEQNELETPLYIIFQTWDDLQNKWSSAKLYTVNSDVKNFYDKLSSKTIELSDGDEKYIYSTSNGNDWELENSNKQNDIYKKNFRRDELQKLIDDRKPTVNLIN